MIDNPAVHVPGREDTPPVPTQLVTRQTATGIGFTGVLALLPRETPRYLVVADADEGLTVFDLLEPSGCGVTIVPAKTFTVAISSDGDCIFMNCFDDRNNDRGLRVYNTGPLLTAAAALLEDSEANNHIAPRTQGPYPKGHGTDAGGAAFSHDSARLFVLWRGDLGITVHDTGHPGLPVLRRMPFSNNGQFSNNLLVCTGGLLAAAAGGGENTPRPTSAEELHLRQQVQVWRVEANDEKELLTLNNPDLADSVALSPKGDLIAIGLRNGVVRMVALDGVGGEEEEVVELEPPDTGRLGLPMAHTLCFNHDGTRLVAGRSEAEDFTVYDVASSAILHRFVHPNSGGGSATFSPAGEVLVTGTRVHSQPCVFHRLLPPAPRFELTVSTSTDIVGSSLTFSDKYGVVIAMAAGSQVEVVTEAGEVLLKHDLGVGLYTSMEGFRSPVQLQPGGELVACALAKRTVVVLSVVDGSECVRLAFPSVYVVRWSLDGALLAVATLSGVRVFSTAAGFAQVKHLVDGENTIACAFDSKRARLAVGSNSRRIQVWDVATWTATHTIDVGNFVWAICFSNSGDRVAFFNGENNIEVVSLDADSDGTPLMVFPRVNALCDLVFSPDDQCLLCCPAHERTFDQHRMRVLDLATGTDAEWGDLLRTMALPVTGGTLLGRTLGWAQLPQPRPPRADTDGIGTVGDATWVLYGAVGRRLVAVDIQATLHAIEDNAWTTEQLAFCSEHQQEHVGSLAESAPHCTNVRDAETGETVFHCLTRTRQVESLQKWLSACQGVPPVADGQGKTAVHVAMKLEQHDSARLMWRKLTPSLTSVSAMLVMQDLQIMSETYPYLVRPFLLDVEPSLVRTLATFRTELAREAEVCGLPISTLPSSTSYGANATDQIPTIWADKCPSDASKTLAASRVVLLPDLLGDAESSPFHDIVTNCDATVFESKLLQLIVQHKWEENVSSLRMRSVALYGIAFVIGAVGMNSGAKGASSTADVLQSLVFIVEVSSLGVEAFELVREGFAKYFTGPWNILDIVSSSLLLYASVCYFEGFTDGVRTAGALGVALKCFGMVDYLRSFPATGSLVRMILVIMADMVPFMTILSFAMLGCMLFFTINLSTSLDLDSDGLGVFRTLVTVYHMTLGIGTGIDIETASVTTVMVVTIFMSFVVVVLLNLLIAIMGDSYEKVKESERVEAVRERARIIVETEKRFPKSHRYYRFMHFMEAADSTEVPQDMMQWEGVTKRVTDMLAARSDQQDRELAELKVDMAQTKSEMNSKLEALGSKLAQTQSELSSKLELVLDRLK